MMMTNESPQVSDIVLAPGEYYFGSGYTRIHTLLGSCVAITLWHPKRHIGGMCHYLLPSRGLNQRLSKGHYADEVVQVFIDAVQKEHAKPRDFEVKLFGGGNMFSSLGHKLAPVNISRSNIEQGIELLKKHGFHIKVADVGGELHRKIYLELWNGDVWVQRGIRTC